MELSNQKKLVGHIFRLLKVNEIVIPIGRTNKGNLGIKFTANQDDFEIYLDAVPLSTKSMLEDENNIELKRMLEKYLFEKEKSDVPTHVLHNLRGRTETTQIEKMGEVIKDLPEKKKRGRPAKKK